MPCEIRADIRHRLEPSRGTKAGPVGTRLRHHIYPFDRLQLDKCCNFDLNWPPPCCANLAITTHVCQKWAPSTTVGAGTSCRSSSPVARCSAVPSGDPTLQLGPSERPLRILVHQLVRAIGRCRLWLAGASVVHDHNDNGQRCTRWRARCRCPVNAPRATSIVGTWSGYLTPSPGNHASRHRFIIVVDRGERAGTWRIGARCAGTLRLKNISWGYHHFYRQAGAIAGCAPLGIDCLKRAGAQMEDEFSSDSAWGDTIYWRRVSRRYRAASRRFGNASAV
jgi:hypothetical protein